MITELLFWLFLDSCQSQIKVKEAFCLQIWQHNFRSKIMEESIRFTKYFIKYEINDFNYSINLKKKHLPKNQRF